VANLFHISQTTSDTSRSCRPAPSGTAEVSQTSPPDECFPTSKTSLQLELRRSSALKTIDLRQALAPKRPLKLLANGPQQPDCGQVHAQRAGELARQPQAARFLKIRPRRTHLNGLARPGLPRPMVAFIGFSTAVGPSRVTTRFVDRPPASRGLSPRPRLGGQGARVLVLERLSHPVRQRRLVSGARATL